MESKKQQPEPPSYDAATASTTITTQPKTSSLIGVPQPGDLPELGVSSARVMCPSCRILVASRLEYSPTTRTHICAGVCCLLLLWPCACCVYCMRAYNSVNHYCPNCNHFIGSFRSNMCIAAKDQ